MDSIRFRFVTGEKNANGEAKEEEEVYGDFEDLETGEKGAADGEDQENEEEEPEEELSPEEQERRALAKKKEALKAKFDSNYDGDDSDTNANFYEARKEEMARQQKLNAEEFEDDDPELRAMVEGYRSGTYVRILIEKIPCEFIDNFDPQFPVILGGLLNTEENYGFIQVPLIDISSCRFVSRSIDGTKRFSRPMIPSSFLWVGVDSRVYPCSRSTITLGTGCSSILLSICIVLLLSMARLHHPILVSVLSNLYQS